MESWEFLASIIFQQVWRLSESEQPFIPACSSSSSWCSSCPLPNRRPAASETVCIRAGAGELMQHHARYKTDTHLFQCVILSPPSPSCESERALSFCLSKERQWLKWKNSRSIMPRLTHLSWPLITILLWQWCRCFPGNWLWLLKINKAFNFEWFSLKCTMRLHQGLRT